MLPPTCDEHSRIETNEFLNIIFDIETEAFRLYYRSSLFIKYSNSSSAQNLYKAIGNLNSVL